MTIRTRPATPEYRHGWDRIWGANFGQGWKAPAPQNDREQLTRYVAPQKARVVNITPGARLFVNGEERSVPCTVGPGDSITVTAFGLEVPGYVIESEDGYFSQSVTLLDEP